ncbi:hypothetical protein N3K66_008295 [Trichothecium roseum]|uniref:Uncharacterized protein n=1 Tax=Trichothecium roseum TaxID=47278 RepID=A0ACC0UT28_9HYPO|nr:hypothetical protein N3K66_008295 [Trichothecium roseum]
MAQRKSALGRQTFYLMKKNWIISLERHFILTLYLTFILPIISAVYLGIFKNLNNPSSEFGFADPRDVLSLGDALGKAESARDTVVFVNNDFTGGDIETVINDLSDQVTAAGKKAKVISDPDQVGYDCVASFRGATNCYGAVVFNSSPDEGTGKNWNYTLRADVLLGQNFKFQRDNNDVQIYTLPLQRAVDQAIANVGGGSSPSLSKMQEWAFTNMTEEQREAEVREKYQDTIIDYLGIAFILALLGVTYHLPGTIATEREIGLSSLLDAMMIVRWDWEPQAARLFSYVGSYGSMYLPGWVIAAIITRFMIWAKTSVVIILFFFILAGAACTSWAVLGGTFFKKAQLSGTVNSLLFIMLGVAAQAIPNPGAGLTAVLGVLFTPCNVVFFIKYIARAEKDALPADLLNAPERSNSTLPGVILYVFFGIQFFIYPIIAAFLERTFHGVAQDGRTIYKGDSGSPPAEAVHIDGMTRIYRPSFLRRMFGAIVKSRPPTVAVNNLQLTAKRGQILCLLGANGSGKSTTLDAVAGLSKFQQGSVTIDASQGIGIAPQKNVLWDDLTVLEHIEMFYKLKCPGMYMADEDIDQLIEAIGLETKRKALSKTLSGGQKRKLQLGMMLVGGSGVCCIDEVSSGVDPLSRRKLWDILLQERGRRTMILTTHFLDEADLLADEIAILTKGELKAHGTSVELKETLGAGYRVHVLDAKNVRDPPHVDGVQLKVTNSTIVYTASSSSQAAEVIRLLEAERIQYRLSSPTIEDVFLAVAEETKPAFAAPPAGLGHRNSDDTAIAMIDKDSMDKGIQLMSGRKVGFFGQVVTLMRKRFILFKTNWFPYLVGFLLPILAAGLTQLLIADKDAANCEPAGSGRRADADSFNDLFDGITVAAGPRSGFPSGAQQAFEDLIPSGIAGGTPSLELQNSYSDWESYIENNRNKVQPGGIWIGGTPTIAYRAEKFQVMTGILTQNLLNTIRTNTSIATNYIPFDSPTPSNTGATLQVALYFSIAVAIFPAFYSLYPNQEKRSSVRGLQYSSGVRSLPLWTAHLAFDYALMLVSMLITAVIFAVTSDVWYEVGLIFPVFLLYALASLLLGYVISLFTESQLATWAAVAVTQGLGVAVYMIAWLFILTFSPPSAAESNVLIGHYVISIFVPAGSLIRALLVGMNVFNTACDGFEFQANPADINAYGGPILYLAVQSVLYFCILLYYDSGNKLPSFLAGKKKTVSHQQAQYADKEMADELVRVEADTNKDGLQVKHLSKSFDGITAVDNVTFGIGHSEVFALLGPNGAGKSTTISMIRGDLAPSKNGGDVFIEQISVTDQRALARANLGVCPQFDAIDSMTVLEHLRHYARIRGIQDIEGQVAAVVRAVGLEAFTNTMAEHLSGGNKRKLSLGIALTGNPSVILLDEPSSGLDAAAKRTMWKTLNTIVPGRSILLTTHSMEEADALATRAGILARRMLAVGEVDELQKRFGDSLYVHLVSKTAPHSTQEEMDRMRQWVQDTLPEARIESATYHGQMRFSVPAAAVLQRTRSTANRSRHPSQVQGGDSTEQSALGALVVLLEEQKDALGIAHHSVTPTTLNEVFLSIVGRHNVQEEGYGQVAQKPWWKKLLMM